MKPTIGPYAADGTVPAADFNTFIDSVKELYDNPNKQGVLYFGELAVAHVNGVEDNFVGLVTNLQSAVAAGVAGGNLTLTPASSYWESLSFTALAKKLTVFSNVLPADLNGATLADKVNISLRTAYKTSAGAATSGQRLTVTMAASGVVTGGGAAPTGVLNVPALVKDSGTLQGEDVAPDNTAAYAIGTGGAFSRYYFTIACNIPATAATKTYKFKVYLSYQ